MLLFLLIWGKRLITLFYEGFDSPIIISVYILRMDMNASNIYGDVGSLNPTSFPGKTIKHDFILEVKFKI